MSLVIYVFYSVITGLLYQPCVFRNCLYCKELARRVSKWGPGLKTSSGTGKTYGVISGNHSVKTSRIFHCLVGNKLW